MLYLLDSPDPDAGAAVGSYLQSLFKGAKVEPSKPDDSLELTSKVEKKYMSALTVEYALQVRGAGERAGEGGEGSCTAAHAHAQANWPPATGARAHRHQPPMPPCLYGAA